MVLVPGTAYASDLKCKGGFANPASGTYDNVVVPSSANSTDFCYLNGATVLGKMTVKEGGATLVANSTIAREFYSDRAGTAVGGGGLTWSVTMCGTHVGRNLTITRAKALVEIGTDDYATCVDLSHPIGNTLDGDVNTLGGNKGGVEFEANQVNGDVTIKNTTGEIPAVRDPDAVPNQSISVNNNSDTIHTLRCAGNSGVVVSSNNTFQVVEGQCNP